MDKRLKDDIQISLGGGVLFGFAIYLIMLRVNRDLWYLCIIAGVALAAILIGYLVGYNSLVTKRYGKAIGKLGYPVLFQTEGNFHTEFGKRTGHIYFCGDRIVLISLNKKPHVTVEILAGDIESYEMPRLVQLNLQRRDGNYHTIAAADLGVLVKLMKKNRWCK